MAFYVRDNSLRCDKWISFTGGFGHESEADIEGTRLFVYRVRLDAAGEFSGVVDFDMCRGRYRDGFEGW